LPIPAFNTLFSKSVDVLRVVTRMPLSQQHADRFCFASGFNGS
jgi:hypothetical protein